MKKRLFAVLLILALLLPSMALATGTGTTYYDTSSTTDVRTLEYGMYGADVMAVQTRLEALGYYTGSISGSFDDATLLAVKNFQRGNNLTVDGKVGKRTLRKLNSDTAKKAGSTDYTSMHSGMSGEDVKELQRQLRTTYYYSGTIDGIFGANVTRAVKAFQASAGLTVDGKVGAKTFNALYNRTAKIFNGGIPVRSLSSGDRGYDVYVLQEKLDSLNYLSITPSGVYGSDTVAAVKAFQKANGLKMDGKAGSTVRRYLWPTTIKNEEEDKNRYEGTPDDPYTEPKLKQGKHGENVARAQMYLKAGGYLLGNADGIFGAKTKAAVIAFQKDYNLKADGIIGTETWTLLKTINISNAEQDVVNPDKPSIGTSVKALRRGSSGEAVTKLQRQLIQLNYLSTGDDDGKFGNKTEWAVRNFQRDQGLAADGICGSQTFVRLNELLGTQWDVPVG